MYYIYYFKIPIGTGSFMLRYSGFSWAKSSFELSKILNKAFEGSSLCDPDYTILPSLVTSFPTSLEQTIYSYQGCLPGNSSPCSFSYISHHFSTPGKLLFSLHISLRCHLSSENLLAFLLSQASWKVIFNWIHILESLGEVFKNTSVQTS